MDNVMQKLQEPFSPDDIEWRVGSTTTDKSKGLALAYVTNRAIQNRLDDVFGPFGWKNEFREWKNDSQICGISIWDDDRKEWITKWDGADDSATEAIKGGLSDAMKRAAYQWGIGRYLYKLDAQWVKVRKQGNSYVLDETPKLPVWAMPGSAQQKTVADKPKADMTIREGQQEVSKMRQEEKHKHNDDLNWKSFWASIRNFGLDEAAVDEIAVNHYNTQLNSLNDVIHSQLELNRFLSVCAKYKKIA
jgi:hypothetical protein